MTPRIPPPGSTTRSSSQVASDASPAGPQAGRESEQPLPWNIGAELSYLVDGQGGAPFRGGLLAQYRPLAYFAAGLHLDTNFSEEFTLSARAEGRLPITENFSLHAALEFGIRALFGQEQFVESLGDTARVSGGLISLGIELGGRVRIADLGIGVFTRILYSPPTGVSVEGPMDPYSNPASIGISGGGHEVLLGIRMELDPQDGVSLLDGEDETPEVETPSAPVSQIQHTREALQSLRSQVDEVLAQSPEADPTETESDSSTSDPRQEVLRGLQQDLTALYSSTDQLEEEISESQQAYQDWNRGTEALNDLLIRMDQIYYNQLTRNPPEPNVDEINGLASDWQRLLEHNSALRSRLQQREEAYATSERLDNQLSAFTDQLAQVRSYFHSHPSGGITRRSFDDAIAHLTHARQTLSELRQEENLQEFRPPSQQITQWRQTLDTMAIRLRQLNGDVPQELRDELQERYQQLRTSFNEEVQRLELEANLREGYERSRPHFYAFTEAQENAGQGNLRQRRARAESATDHLRTIHATFQDMPPEFFQRYRRSLLNLKNILIRFVESAPPRPTAQWREAQRAAIQVIHQIDADYQAPEIPETPVRRRIARPRTGTARSPRRSGTPPRSQPGAGAGGSTETPPAPSLTQPPTESDE